ncbi:MAG: hypothetical protein HW412_1298 [Bacteroidetes bacterium]|nr:hypothetical protein [Bacteroidota bacterium]
MKIIVTGGSGFIGSALIPRLIAEGHEVVLLSRNPTAARLKLDSRVKVESWDGTTSGLWEMHVDGADAVVNFAGEPLDAKRWSRTQKDRIIGSRVGATNALVRAIQNAKKKPSVFISASGVGYYGPVEEGELSEDSPRGSDFLSEVTSQWEKAAHGAEGLGVRTVVLRIAVVLGDNGGALRKLLIPFKLFVGGVLGSGRQWFPWIHRDDLIGVIMFALTNPKVSGTVNVVAPESVTMKEFCKALGRVLHRPSWAPVPSFVLKVMLGEMSDMVLTGQRAVPKGLERLGYKFKFPQLETALRDILQ